MKNAILTLFLIFLAAIFAAGQQPAGSPTPPDQDVVKISTNLIQIDVSVTDKKGNVITDLRPEEVEIYENGEKQKITNFSFVKNIRTPPPEKSEAVKGEKNNAVILPSGPPRPERVRRTIALVVDDLSLSFASANWVQQAARKFVNEQMQDGDLVAIIRTGAGIGALQQFTTDRRQLLAAVEKIRFNLAGNARIGIFNPVTAPLEGQSPGATQADDPGGDQTGVADQELNELRESIFASGTLGALNYVIRGMRELPGRKSIILLSDGFRLFIRDARGMPEATRILDSLRRLTDLANRASVVVYAIDARGLVVTGFTAEDDLSGRSAEDIERQLQSRRDELFDSQEGLTYLARQTGGFAVINSNDINRGIRRVLDDQSYYLVGYTPDDETFDPRTRRYNKLVVKVSRPGLRVRYRSGFFGIATEIARPPAMTASQKLLNALTSPFAANEIPLKLNALFAADRNKAAFLRSFVHVDSGGLTFTRDANGTYKTVFDVIAYSFGDNGIPVDSLSKTFTVNLQESAYKRVIKTGFVYEFTFPVKKPGGYQVRVALRNPTENTVGSANQFVEVPNLKKNRIVLSGVVLEGLDPEQWKRLEADPEAYQEIRKTTDARTSTTLRQFKPGTILRWGLDIYNAGPMSTLVKKVKIYRDGKVIFDGPSTPVPGASQVGNRTVNGVLRLGAPLIAGEYILQILVTDSRERGKPRTVSQLVQFEIVE